MTQPCWQKRRWRESGTRETQVPGKELLGYAASCKMLRKGICKVGLYGLSKEVSRSNFRVADFYKSQLPLSQHHHYHNITATYHYHHITVITTSPLSQYHRYRHITTITISPLPQHDHYHNITVIITSPQYHYNHHFTTSTISPQARFHHKHNHHYHNIAIITISPLSQYHRYHNMTTITTSPKASCSHLQLLDFDGRLAQKLRFHIFHFHFWRDVSHKSVVFTSSTFTFSGTPRTKASFSHLPLALFEGRLARKRRFHIFTFHFLREVSHKSFVFTSSPFTF